MGDSGSPTQTHAQTSTENSPNTYKISIPFLLNWTNPNSRLTDTFQRSSDDPFALVSIPNSDDTTVLRESRGTHTYGCSQSWFDMDMRLTPSNSRYPSPLLLSDYSLFRSGACPDAGVSLSPPSDPDILDQASPNVLLPVMDRSQYQDEMGVSTTQTDAGYHSCSMAMDRDLPAEFADHLTALTLSLPRDHPEHAPNINLALGMSTLTSANIARFLRLYFHHWNRHSPVVHPGTFDIFSATLPLLLVMTLTGAMFSLSPEDVAAAKSMLDLSEEFAFRDQDFQKMASGIFPERLDQRRRALQALQAAFSVAQLQLREGSMWKRECVRSLRFDQIIYVS